MTELHRLLTLQRLMVGEPIGPFEPHKLEPPNTPEVRVSVWVPNASVIQERAFFV